MPPVGNAATADALHLDVCPGCAYQLQGLPPEGVCPECGRAYDQRVVILYGWATGSKADAGNAKPWHAAALAAAPLVYCTLRLVRAWSRGEFVRLALFGLWAAAIAWFLYRRFVTFRGPGLTQVRLSEAGCVQADSTSEADEAEATPWEKVEDVTLERAGDDLWRLRLASGKTWYGSRTTFVDAEVRCTDERASALGDRIGTWRRPTAAEVHVRREGQPAAPDDVPPEGFTCGPGGAVQ